MNAWPLIVRHAEIPRILRATQLIVTACPKPGTYDIQDQLVVRSNDRRRRNGRHDEQTDPSILTIQIVTVDEMQLVDLDLKTVRAAGHKTQRDFYDDWLAHRLVINPGLLVRVCHFIPVEQDRFLDRRVHRGYTVNPAHAVTGDLGEGAVRALNAVELKHLAGANRRRFEREHREELLRQRARSVHARLKDAIRLEDWDGVERLRDELSDLAAFGRAA